MQRNGCKDESNYIRLKKDLMRAYLAARRGKRRSVDEYNFEINAFENIEQLATDIYLRSYHPSRGIAFVIRKPVIREIFAAPFRDRVVHHYIYNYIMDWWDKRLIYYDAYSCRPGKGALVGIQRLQHFMRKVSQSGTQEAWIVKLDIQGYFMSLPRIQLYERARWGLERQFADKMGDEQEWFIYETLLFLLSEVIFDDPTDGVRRRGNLRDWDDVPKSKSLFCQPAGQGIVIGNLTSQLLSNIYLDQLDRFVYYELGRRAYGRYVDDFYIIIQAEEKKRVLEYDMPMIEKFLGDIGLKLHPNKRYVQNIWHGAPFLGAKVYPNRIVPDKRIVQNFREVVKNPKEDLAASVMSYLGHFKYMDSKRVERALFDENGWKYYF